MRLSRIVVLFYNIIIIIGGEALNQTNIVQLLATLYYMLPNYIHDSVTVARVNNTGSGFLRQSENQHCTYLEWTKGI